MDAALALALVDEDGPTAITGATLGRALNVDRSAIWRHFADRDDLFASLYNEMLEPVVEAAGRTGDPWDRLSAVFESIIEACLLRPLLARDAVVLSPRGQNWRLLSERLISTLGELGLGPEQSAGYFRMSLEIIQSYAAALAVDEMRPAADRDREMEEVRRELRSFDPDEYPHLYATGRYLENIRQADVTERILNLLRLAVEHARAAQTSAPAETPTHGGPDRR